MRTLTSITVTAARKPKRKKPDAPKTIRRSANDYPLGDFGGGKVVDRGKKR